MKKYLCFLFLMPLLSACHKADDPGEAPCDAAGSVLAGQTYSGPGGSGTTTYSYDAAFVLRSYSVSSASPEQVVYHYYGADGYDREHTGTNAAGPYYHLGRVYLDGSGKLVRTYGISERDTAYTDESFFWYDNDGRVRAVRSESRSRSNGYRYGGSDSVVYTWNGGNIVRGDRYYSGDSVRYNPADYTVYTYDDAHSGRQVQVLFCKGENPYIHPEVAWRYTRGFVVKAAHYMYTGSFMDSVAYTPQFDSRDRLTGLTTTTYSQPGSPGSVVTAGYTYRCR